MLPHWVLGATALVSVPRVSSDSEPATPTVHAALASDSAPVTNETRLHFEPCMCTRLLCDRCRKATCVPPDRPSLGFGQLGSAPRMNAQVMIGAHRCVARRSSSCGVLGRLFFFSGCRRPPS